MGVRMKTARQSGHCVWAKLWSLGPFSQQDCQRGLESLVNSHTDVIANVEWANGQWHCRLSNGQTLSPAYGYEDAVEQWSRELYGPGANG